MRVAWIALSVTLSDFISKLLLANSSIGGTVSIPGVGVLTLLSSDSPGVVQRFSPDPNNAGWLLVAGLLSLLLLMFRRGSVFLDATTKAGIGIQLVSGGIFSQVIDLLLYGALTPVLDFDTTAGMHLSTGLGELAIVAGLILTLADMLQQRFRATPYFPLRGADTPVIDFSMLPRGVDNVHIDVILSSSFSKAAGAAVADLVPRYIKEIKSGNKRVRLEKDYYSALQAAYVAMVQAATRKAKETGEPQLLELLQVAVIKFLHEKINQETIAAVQRYSELLHEQKKRGAGGGSHNDHVKWLFRNRELIFYRVSESVFLALAACEKKNLAKLRRVLHGDYKSVAATGLTVPLVQATSPLDSGVQLNSYLLFGLMDSDPNSFPNLDQVLRKAFADVPLPADSTLTGFAGDGGHERVGSEYLRALAQPTALQTEENVTLLLDQDWSEGERRAAKDRKDRRRARRLRRHRRFQHHRMEKLKKLLRQCGLLSYILASYEAARLFRHKQWDVDPHLLHKALRQEGTRAEQRRKLQSLLRGSNVPDLNELLSAWERTQKVNDRELVGVVLQFVRDFTAYRRDLLLAHNIQQASNKISLLSDEKDIRTSRANFTLHEFLTVSESNTLTRAIRAHAIIKADLRGSTEITDKLVEMDLNPAAHFSRYFFDPINEIIDRYGAEKVFIEGDAIILIINEFSGDHQEHLTVARASGLASGIIQVVAEQNKQLACHGLPELELGIGIAYNDSPPRYLFDGKTKITISPAINRADRLSACAWAVRQWVEKQNFNALPVAVYEPSKTAKSTKEKAQKDLVYNLNGILLEPSAYAKLRREVRMSRLTSSSPRLRDAKVYAARFPDTLGNFQTLVVREAPVRVYDPSCKVDECPPVEGRFFHEVVHDRALIKGLSKARPAAMES